MPHHATQLGSAGIFVMVIPPARQKFYRYINGLIGQVQNAPDAPARLVQSLIHLWQGRNFPLLLPSRAPRGTAPFLTEQAVIELADWLCDQPFNEAAYWLASAYALWVGKEVRAQRALFFTPPRLAVVRPRFRRRLAAGF